jgi:hypothetical protein
VPVQPVVQLQPYAEVHELWLVRWLHGVMVPVHWACVQEHARLALHADELVNDEQATDVPVQA